MATIELGNLTKLYYSIGEVSELFGVSPSLIRYWESEFTQLKPHKNAKGERRYTRQNIEQLQQIFHLVKEKGYTLEGARKVLKESKNRSLQIIKIEKKLLEIKQKLQELQNRL